MKTHFPSFNAGAWLRFDAVALNPQPLPPRQHAANFSANPLVVSALNPQPLPPKDNLWPFAAQLNPIVLNRQSPVSKAFVPDLKVIGGGGLSADPLTSRGLNPQPLPPKESPTGLSSRTLLAFARGQLS